MIRKFLLFIAVPFMMFFSFAPFNLGFLFIFAYSIILILTYNLKRKKRILYVFIVFLLFWFITLHWFLIIQVEFTFLQRILIFFGLILLSGVLSILWTLPFIITDPKSRSIYLLPFIFASIEFLSSIENNTAFLWLSPSYSLINYKAFIQSADIGGMYLISAFVLMISVLLFRLAVSQSKRQRMILIGLMVVIVLGNLAYGLNALSKQYCDEFIDVSVVQPNIPGFAKEHYHEFTDMRTGMIIDYLEKLKDIEQDLIVFPETASPVYIQRGSQFNRYIRAFADSNNKNIMMGSLRLEYNKEKKHFNYYNSAYLIESNGRMEQYYDKIRPLGFAERLPFDDKFRFLKKVPLGQSDFSPGSRYTLFDTGQFSFGTYICFESVFATIPARFTGEGAELLVNISEDIWFEGGIGPYQHFSAGIMRSIENRRYIVRSSNPGISAVIDPAGRIIESMDMNSSGIINAEAGLNDNLTFFTRFDNIIPKIFILLLIVFYLIKIMRRKYGNKSKNSA